MISLSSLWMYPPFSDKPKGIVMFLCILPGRSSPSSPLQAESWRSTNAGFSICKSFMRLQDLTNDQHRFSMCWKKKIITLILKFVRFKLWLKTECSGDRCHTRISFPRWLAATVLTSRHNECEIWRWCWCVYMIICSMYVRIILYYIYHIYI